MAKISKAATPGQHKWFTVSMANPSRPEIRVYGNIVSEQIWATDVAPDDFISQLDAIDAPDMDVRISSSGGNFYAANLMYTALRRHPARVNTYVDSQAASAASFLAMAGDTRYIAETGSLMLHLPSIQMYAAGNRIDIEDISRQALDALRVVEESAKKAYLSRWTGTEEELTAALEAQTEYTAQEAVDAGLVDEIFGVVAATDAAVESNGNQEDLRMKNTEVAAPQMRASEKPVETAKVETAKPEINEAQMHAIFAEKEQKRRGDIKMLFAPFRDQSDLLMRCLDDMNMNADKASVALLDELGKGAAPVNSNTRIETTMDAKDKFRQGAAAGLLMRLGPQYIDPRSEIGNEYRGMTMVDCCRESLRLDGVNMKGLSRSRIVEMAFTQSTSDIPNLLENTMHKLLQSAYEVAPSTWRRFCRAGSVADFRVNTRLRLGSISDLQGVNENGEFKQVAFDDAEKETISATTKGLIVAISRQMFINDDLDGLSRTVSMMGQSAARTVDKDVFALFALNSGMGPTMTDGNPLWDAAHSNLGTSGTVSVASFENARVVMATQLDPSGNDYLDLMPAVWVGPTAIGGEAKVVNNAEYDIDRTSKYAPPNKSRGLFRDIVDTPRLTGAPWYAFADPSVAPVFEVVFLDGVQTPFLDQMQGWTVDGTSYKVRLDYGVGATDFRGTVRNAGT